MDLSRANWSSHVKIIIQKEEVSKKAADDVGRLTVVTAASRISRIAEDMLAEGIVRYGQMHLLVLFCLRGWARMLISPRITSFFSALCIHSIAAKGSIGVPRRIAIHRARICLLGLKEVQQYWRINNSVLGLFFQHLDVSVAQWLHDGPMDSATSHEVSIKVQTNEPCLATLTPLHTLSTPQLTTSNFPKDHEVDALPESYSIDDAFLEQDFALQTADLFHLGELDSLGQFS